jgi:hypothetical protein
VQAALRSLEPLPRLIQVTKEMHRVPQETRVTNDLAGFIGR